MLRKAKRHRCPVCGKPARCVPGSALGGATRAAIRQLHPDWMESEDICVTCLLQSLTREADPVDDGMLEDQRTFGERMADKLTAFVGSWAFIGWQMLIFLIWVSLNTLLVYRYPFDPYPFILLNLMISWAAAIEAPIILMSQNRQDTRDRLRDEKEYRTNLVAEEEIRQLHDKLDQFIAEYQSTLAEIRSRWRGA